MTKIKTFEQLQLILDEELVWRTTELALIRSLVVENASFEELASYHIRSGITLVYAHWEGYIKAVGNAYLMYIASQRLMYSDLTSNFVAIAAKRLLSKTGLSNKITAYAEITDFFLSGLTDRCTLPMEVETKSNLSSEVLREITYVLGLDYREYETKARLLDETLLKSRNEVAHGKYLLIDTERFVTLGIKWPSRPG